MKGQAALQDTITKDIAINSSSVSLRHRIAIAPERVAWLPLTPPLPLDWSVREPGYYINMPVYDTVVGGFSGR